MVVAIGECMIELTRAGDGWRLDYAGDTYNTAVYLARLGLRVAYVSATGTDPFSDAMRARWAAEGIDASLAPRDPDRLPGLYAVSVDDAGERSFHYWREASAARRLLSLPGADAAIDAAARADLVYLSGITLSLFDADGRARLIDLCARVRAGGGTVAFDPNYRVRGWADAATARAAFDAIAPHVTVALPTFEDEAALFGDRDQAATAARWRAFGATEVVVKAGAAGCLVGVGDEAAVHVPALPGVIPKDTTGAGDAFNAGYLASRRRGAQPIEAAHFGHRLAAEVVRHFGAIIPAAAMPTLP